MITIGQRRRCRKHACCTLFDDLSQPPDKLQLRLPAGNNGETHVVDVFGGPQAISPSIESRIRTIAGF